MDSAQGDGPLFWRSAWGLGGSKSKNYRSLTDSVAQLRQQEMISKWWDCGETECRDVVWNHLMTTVEGGGRLLQIQQ